MDSVSSQAEMLHPYGSKTEQGSMEVAASHKKHFHMNFHLCKDNQLYIMSIVAQNILAHRR